MEMKQRIIGLIVLLALGVILVPLIFDSETVIKPSRVAVAETKNPEATLNLTAPPNKNFTPAPSIIQPGAIEASANRMLEHPSQSSAFAFNEPQDFDDREDDELKSDVENQIANEEELQAEFNSAEDHPQPEASTKDLAFKKNDAKNLADKKLPHPLNLAQKNKELQPSTAVRKNYESQLSTVVQKGNESKLSAVAQKSKASHTSAQGNWAIQLGSFSEVANANNLVSDLKSKGFNAFTERHHNNKSRHRVLIGPEADRESADAIVAKLDQQHHIKSIVVRYR